MTRQLETLYIPDSPAAKILGVKYILYFRKKHFPAVIWLFLQAVKGVGDARL